MLGYGLPTQTNDPQTLPTIVPCVTRLMSTGATILGRSSLHALPKLFAAPSRRNARPISKLSPPRATQPARKPNLVLTPPHRARETNPKNPKTLPRARTSFGSTELAEVSGPASILKSRRSKLQLTTNIPPSHRFAQVDSPQKLDPPPQPI